MAVEKMYFANIAGPIKEIDEYVIHHVIPYEIQLVKTLSVIDSMDGLDNYNEQSPFDPILKQTMNLCREMGIEAKPLEAISDTIIDINAIEQEVNLLTESFEVLIEKRNFLTTSKTNKEQLMVQVQRILSMDVEVNKLFDFHYMKFRFGKVPLDSYQKIIQYIDNLNVIMYEVSREGNDVYIVYFMPRIYKKEIDEYFTSLYFARIFISDEIQGYPKEVLPKIEIELTALQQEICQVNDLIVAFIKKNKERVMNLYGMIHQSSVIFTVRQYAVRTKETFCMSGWVPASRVDDFIKSIRESAFFSYEVEDETAENKIMPPTKLNNNRFFKPFEAFINMYAVPSYKEMDPTVYVGITYLLMFAIMFGDVGQGLVIAFLGYLVYKKTKSTLGNIAIYLGLCSMISGLFYGCFFGNEEILPEYLGFIPMINPIESTKGMLIFAVILGIILILSAMIFNILNAIKHKNKGRMYFDRNGIIGLVFYISILCVALIKVLTWKISVVPIVLIVVVSMFVIFMSHPLQNFIKGKKEILPKDKVGFFIEAFFELFETVLGVLSNTISFVRVGAFALNHVGFFLAFHMLSDMVNERAGSVGGLMVMIFGNVLIIVLEGLIVAIQGLRLEYYELFSRFFEGEGTEFKPFIKIKNYN